MRSRDKRLYRRGRFWWARVTDERGRIVRVSTRCTDAEAASAFADEWERRAANPAYRRAAEATLEDGIRDWFAELDRRKLSEATISIARTKAGHFVRLWGADLPLLHITNDRVLGYIDAREGELAGREAARHTIKKELGALKGILEWARFRGVFPHDLATVLPPKYSSGHRPRSRWLTLDEARRLIRALTPDRAAHVAFILATGARRGESFRARREDVHHDDVEPYVVLRGTKTERAREDGTVPITGITYLFLRFALERAPGKGAKPLFRPWGKMVRDLDKACARAGIAKASANDLRRTFGKWHRLAGASAEQVAVMLRHTTDKLAQTTYGRIDGREIGRHVRLVAPLPQLPAGSVPDLYAETAQTDSNDPNGEDDMQEITVSPARLERATPGLGSQETSGVSGPEKTDLKSALASLPGPFRVSLPYLAAERAAWDAYDALEADDDTDGEP